MSSSRESHRSLLLRVARRAMIERGFEPDFPVEALHEAEQAQIPHPPFDAQVRDLRTLPWCSIDNDDSRDLDQLTAAEALADGGTRMLVAIADVSTLVTSGSAVDDHARTNTTSIYTPPRVFSMLPEELSTDRSSLGQDVDRLAIVVEVTVDGAGGSGAASVFRAAVRNRAKLAYSNVGAWLEGRGELAPAGHAVPGLAANLRLQDQVAQRLRAFRHEHGALELETIETHAAFEGDAVSGLTAVERNRAKELIEDFMIAANGAVARFLDGRGFPVVRRVVRSPGRWQRIMDLARDGDETLPPEPDAKALHDFLVRRRAADPLRFPDLSLSIIKMLGKGEYAVSFPGETADGHFGLAVSDYTHSTAPNRRYPDLITQRLLLAALAGGKAPYAPVELEELARHCTRKEDDAQKVERLVHKAAAACLLHQQLGRQFDGIVTGASPKGTWVRIFDPPVEGRVEQGEKGLDVGERLRVKLIRADPERGFIDFARIGRPLRERRRR